ncbi:MAG: 23S rRNA (uracil(1939)-C(5))-methyltransferase RlmD [Gammaproteobacteria bacterium]|nr:23S rRNA (uracil(1939)-C(5))-methyltransferase RlmD [Gammaproteobacteria bacterium]
MSTKISQTNPYPELLHPHTMDLEGRAIALNSLGKVVFIEGAIHQEAVYAQTYKKKNSWELAKLDTLMKPSYQRVEPRCSYFGLQRESCGGCTMQHLSALGQLAIKQRSLEDCLQRLGKVVPEQILPAIEGPVFAYRARARLSVRFVPAKSKVLVGFHERKSSYVADMQYCHILHPKVASLLPYLQEMFGNFEAKSSCPQIEVACGSETVALVLRNLEPLHAKDLDHLRKFGSIHQIQWWLQPKGPDSIYLLPDQAVNTQLYFELPFKGLRIYFKPTDFIQINPFINPLMLKTAISQLKPSPSDRAIDWFCGLGNFTLALATQCQYVLGVEGNTPLVSRAKENYVLNQKLGHRLAEVDYQTDNLFTMDREKLQNYPAADMWILDPPREGALALVKSLSELRTQAGYVFPKRILYVSCDPATLARDAGILVHLAHYRCKTVRILDMFPQTSHIESMVLFESN